MVTRNSQICYLARKTLGATDLKLGMHIQLHFGSYMGWVIWPHLLISMYKANIAKNSISEKQLNHEPIYIWNQYNLENVLSSYM